MKYPFVMPQFSVYRETNNLLPTVASILLNLVDEEDRTEAAENFTKYLFYDDPTPLANEAPTMAQRRALIYNPLTPQTTNLKGYRVMFQQKRLEQQVEAVTEIRLLYDTPRLMPIDNNKAIFFFTIEIFTNMAYATIKGGQYRPHMMAQAAMDCLVGRFLGDGIGHVFLSNGYGEGRGYLGLSPITDDRNNEGIALTMGVYVGSNTVRDIPNGESC
jgi:hypothetical protein